MQIYWSCSHSWCSLWKISSDPKPKLWKWPLGTQQLRYHESRDINILRYEPCILVCMELDQLRPVKLWFVFANPTNNRVISKYHALVGGGYVQIIRCDLSLSFFHNLRKRPQKWGATVQRSARWIYPRSANMFKVGKCRIYSVYSESKLSLWPFISYNY